MRASERGGEIGLACAFDGDYGRYISFVIICCAEP